MLRRKYYNNKKLIKPKSSSTELLKAKQSSLNNAVGIFGGTFDPIHSGHLITAQSVLEIRNLKKIIFVPAFISPFKQNIKTTEARHRLEMIRLSIKDKKYFDVSDFELKNKNISYTIDTLKYFKKKYDALELLIGYDNIFEFAKWKDPRQIIKLAKLVVIKRSIEKKPRENDIYFKNAVFIDTPIIEISSTDIRRKIKENKPIDFLVSSEVKNYIYKNNLYKENY